MSRDNGTSGSWIILGATSAIAQAFAREVVRTTSARKEPVPPLLLAARNTAALDADAAHLRLTTPARIETVVFEAGNTANLETLVETARRLPAPINVFVALGAMPEQDAMRQDSTLFNRMVLATYTGPVQVLNALTPLLEAQRGGAVILLGSVAGDRGRKKNYLYGSAKAGLHAFTQGLAAHLSSFSVSVLLVKPGVIDTAMTWGLKNPPLPLGTPEGLARACLRRASRGGVLFYPWFWRWIMLIITHLPRRIFNKLNF